MCGKKSAGGQQIRERVKTGAEKLSMALFFKILSVEKNLTRHSRERTSEGEKIDVPERIGGADNPFLPKLILAKPLKTKTRPGLNSPHEAFENKC